MSKGLEALQHLYAIASVHTKLEKISYMLDLHHAIEKELKALEIIKHFIKSLGLTFIFSNDKIVVIIGGDEFEYWYKCETQEEYDLLREVLQCNTLKN